MENNVGGGLWAGWLSAAGPALFFFCFSSFLIRSVSDLIRGGLVISWARGEPVGMVERTGGPPAEGGPRSGSLWSFSGSPPGATAQG